METFNDIWRVYLYARQIDASEETSVFREFSFNEIFKKKNRIEYIKWTTCVYEYREKERKKDRQIDR